MQHNSNPFQGDPIDKDRGNYPQRYSPIPPNGKYCPFTGLKHAYLYRLLRYGAASKYVRIAHLKEPGCSRGRLLFHVGDMLRWLDAQASRNGDQVLSAQNDTPQASTK